MPGLQLLVIVSAIREFSTDYLGVLVGKNRKEGFNVFFALICPDKIPPGIFDRFCDRFCFKSQFFNL
jgi:hypothetical protein